MKYINLIPIMIVLLLSGCIGNFDSVRNGEDRIVGQAHTREDNGSGYIEEYATERLTTVKLDSNQFLTHFTVLINWDDESPVNDRAVPYENEGDQFTLKVTLGSNVEYVDSTTNPVRAQGRAYIHLEGDVVDNQSSEGGILVTVDLTLSHAGDQYPVYHRNERMKVEDNGNDYIWNLEYTYVEKDN